MAHDIGLKISLDTGDLVSSAGRARQSIAGLTEEMQKADKEGRHIDVSLLSFEKNRLEAKTAGFERDIKTLHNDPRIQTQIPAGAPALKMDSEYANLIKSHTEAMRKLTDEYQEATRGGNIERVRELTPQIERQQSEFHKTVRDIINTGGDFSKRPIVEASPLPGGLPKQAPQNEEWRDLKGFSASINRAHDTENWEQVAKLGIAQDTLNSVIGQFDRDTKNETKLKADPEFASQLKDIRDALKATIAALNDAVANNDLEKVELLTEQANQLQGVSHNMIEANSLPAAVQGGKDAQKALSTFLNVQTAQQIVGAVDRVINTRIAHLNRSSIVNAMGGGDPMGAQIEELHRSAAEKSGFWESAGRIGGGIAGGGLTAAAFALSGPTGGISLAALPFIAGGSTLASSLLGTVGSHAGDSEEKKANEMTTSESYAKQWEQQAPGAMELTAMFGKYDGTPEQNSLAIRRTWENAANTATEYGFDPGEGVALVKQAAGQGLDELQSLRSARDVFAFERGTGADRGTLAGVDAQMARYGVSGALQTAWQGNQASGMAPAQFTEYLRATQKTFEDGISKGFVRGSSEIAGNFAFLSDLNGGSELWKGEQGANRLATMNAGLAATTGLSSASDILAFRGAQKLLAQWSPEDWNHRIGNLDNSEDGSVDLRRGYDYIDSMAILERGLRPELFHSQMKMFEEVEGPGNRTGIVEQMKNVYGLNYTGSAALYQAYGDKKEEIRKENSGLGAAAINKKIDEFFSGDTWKKTIESYQANPEFMSKELEQLSVIKDIQKYISDTGQRHFDARMDQLQTALVDAFKEAGPNTSDTDAGVHAPPNTSTAAGAGTPLPPPPPTNSTPAQTPVLVPERPGGGGTADDRRSWADATEQNLLMREAAEEMLFKSHFTGLASPLNITQQKTATFFTGNGNGRIDTEDEQAHDRLQAFGKAPEGSESYMNYWKSMGILGDFTNTEREYVNNNNSINTAVNDAMTDKTGQRLVELLIELRDNTKELHLEER